METPMGEPAFRLLRQGLPSHLQTRLIYKSGTGSTSIVLARGLAVLKIDDQLNQLMEWLTQMSGQIPGLDGLSAAQREQAHKTLDDSIIKV